MRLARVLALLLSLAALAAPAASAHHPAGVPAEDAARGLEYDGLRPATADGPCNGVGYELTAGVRIGCTHGPDPAPAGVDVRETPPLAELRASTEAAAPVPCIGDGTSGMRVQAIYARPSDRPSQYATVEPLIQGWSAEMNDMVRASARGARDVRFVTDEACRATVLNVTVTPNAAENFEATIQELALQGFVRNDRKYLVWMDASKYCGIAGMYPDSRVRQLNRNNGPLGVAALVARVDTGCWDGHTATHELVHTLGAVQGGSPNATAYGHCTDEYDVMCYTDGAGTMLRIVCFPRSTYEARLDCNGDDYFNVSPAPGSWLGLHWNVANSVFLEGGVVPPPPAAPTALRATSAGQTQLAFEWASVSGAVAYGISLDGMVRENTGFPRIELNGLPCGRSFELGVEALDARGETSARAVASASTLACPDRQPPVVTPRAVSGKRGQFIKLRYGVSDAAHTRETISIYRGTTRTKTLTTAFGPSTSGQSVRWRIPANAKGPLRFCVRAADRTGNPSETRCAPIRLP